MAHLSIFRLLKDIPLSTDYSDTLTFVGVSEQSNYFISKSAYSFTNLMYIRKGMVQIPNQAGLYRTCTYCMWQNPDYPNKWFYGFVTSVEYVADGTTIITFVEDIIQTWFYDMTLQECMVQREHVNNDSVGSNLKEENVALGDYVVNTTTPVNFTTWALIVASAVSLDNPDVPASADTFQGTLSGLGLYAFSLDSSGVTALRQKLASIAEQGKSNAIVDMWSVPLYLVDSTDLSGGQVNDNLIDNSAHVISVNSPSSLNGYTPRNKKLLTYPYTAMEISNRAGNNVSLRYEFFSGSPILQYRGSPVPSGKIILVPTNYKNVGVYYDYSVSIGNYPHASWTQDVYSNWLATESIKWEAQSNERSLQASWNNERAFISAIAGVGMSATTGNIPGIAQEGFEGVMNMLDNAINYEHNEQLAANAIAAEKEIHSIIPPSAKGTIGDDTTQQAFRNIGFDIRNKSITAEYAKSIDDYFDMYGYRVDVVKVPNISGRQSWNYVQTIGAIVTGNAPLYAKEGFRGLLNRGIRFWHNTDVGNYNLPNNPVTGG